MTDQQFCPVTRKKWIARKSLNKNRHVHRNSKENVLQEVDIPRFLLRLQSIRDHMKSSDYFQQTLSTLNESLQELEGDNITQLVCFGIGPFTRSFQALHQFAFFLELQKHLEIADSFYFDPVFRTTEKKILETLECTVLKENCEGKYPSECVTLFYLPHCPTSLTNNLLWRNWTPEMLSKIVLINNSFESLSCNTPERLFRTELQYIFEALPYTKEFALEDCYETLSVFNDLSIHVFPMKLLPEKGLSFWDSREAPDYASGEIVLTDEFGKLEIS